MTIDIDKLTVGELKELQKLISCGSPINNSPHPMLGKKCIIRTFSAGVHYGELAEKEGKEVILKNARRL